jgi:nitric oxide reductase subunit B
MRKLWIAFSAVLVLSFAILIAAGVGIYLRVPPIPDAVVTRSGRTLLTGDDIRRGQNVWQAMGGMELGSVWGHGSYIAPDWTADYLHRQSMHVLDSWSGGTYSSASAEKQAALSARLRVTVRENTFDEASGKLTLDDGRAAALPDLERHYASVFREGRDEYAIPADAMSDPTRLRQLSAFFFWTAWAASTNRPGETITYTSNWPHEKLIGNEPTGDTVVWTGVSIILLLAGIGGMAWWFASQKRPMPQEMPPPESDPLLGHTPTPSQRATIKYFWVVSLLVLVQILLGVITAHYGVEGSAFYGIPLAKVLPYTITRTWHLQIGIFWIATAWLAAGLYIAPAVSGVEPKHQALGAHVLFGALLVLVVGSLAGEWLSVKGKLSDASWFWLGHSGYEYIDLGRLWQIVLLIGLLLWLGLVLRGVWPALKRRDEQRPVLALFVISSIAIAGFYGAALGYGRHTNLAIAEYWRWWVVHLWVEGFFEVFATVVIAFLFARMRLVEMRSVALASVLSATIFLAGGIVGTLHHLYFAGTPTYVLALGSVFSALEVVPLVLIGFEAWENVKISRAGGWVRQYRWPVYFFVAVAFWNIVGAGLFGFMINPPIALYYMQGLHTTPVHGHTALFGVYGMLGLGLMLFCLRAMEPANRWRDGWVAAGFWGINIGLLLMVLISVLPLGLMQTWASVTEGYWYARSAEFMQTPIMNTLRWLRVIGDTIFAIGALILVAFVFGLATGHSVGGRRVRVAKPEPQPPPTLEPSLQRTSKPSV